MVLQLFSTQDGRPLDWEAFLAHPLGQLYQTIPFQGYAKLIPAKKTLCGRKPWFDVAGGIGLQILKHRYGCSDEKLIELLNENKKMQYFCGISLGPGVYIKDDDVVSRWRSFLGQHLSMGQIMEGFQKVTAKAWKKDMEQTQTNLCDATCYESYVRYPTDVKLLWECIEYLYNQIKKLCRVTGLPMLRSKYKEQKQKYLAYRRLRRKPHNAERRVRKRLLYLLNKYLGMLPVLIAAFKHVQTTKVLIVKPFKVNFFYRLSIIKKVYQQQQLRYDHPDKKIEDRIVSLAKPYLRPIVRGKETKRVEFGMKVNEMQIDGINFIEHWSFNAFHEGNRFKYTMWRHQRLFKEPCRLAGADQIYATNANRRFCTSQSTFTCFKPKGRKRKDEQVQKQAEQMRQLLGKERATRLEGSFGNKKNHYLLQKVKAKNYFTELSWIFFGNLTANATLMAKRINAPPLQNTG